MKQKNTDKIKFSQLPTIVKIILIFVSLEILIRVVVLCAYSIIFINDGSLDRVDFDKIEIEQNKAMCDEMTNHTYLNYDSTKKVCYTHICPEGAAEKITYADDLDKYCEYKAIPFNEVWIK